MNESESEAETEVKNEIETTSEPVNNDNVMAAVAYVLTFISGAVVYLIEKDKTDKSKFIMFHAIQSIIFGVVVIIVWSVLTIISFLPIIGGIIAMLTQLAIFILWIFLIYKAYSGEEYHIPVIGEFADKYV